MMATTSGQGVSFSARNKSNHRKDGKQRPPRQLQQASGQATAPATATAKPTLTQRLYQQHHQRPQDQQQQQQYPQAMEASGAPVAFAPAPPQGAATVGNPTGVSVDEAKAGGCKGRRSAKSVRRLDSERRRQQPLVLPDTCASNPSSAEAPAGPAFDFDGPGRQSSRGFRWRWRRYEWSKTRSGEGCGGGSFVVRRSPEDGDVQPRVSGQSGETEGERKGEQQEQEGMLP